MASHVQLHPPALGAIGSGSQAARPERLRKILFQTNAITNGSDRFREIRGQ